MPCGTLYVVPTPIGNLEDITLRAVRTLKECDLIACEDTRQTAKLLNHLGISKRLVSFYSYNQAGRIPQLIGDLRAGLNVALVSDGGTPGVSDPGFFLTSKAVEEGIPVVALPGPSAAVTALVGSGLPSDGFVFLGFLKKKPSKMKKELQAALGLGMTVVFYESPHRIRKTMELVGELVSPDAKLAIGRELTKKFEEYIRGTAAEVCAAVRERELIGELTVLISEGRAERKEREEDEEN